MTAELKESFEYKNRYGRPNYIERYYNPNGYKYKCRECDEKSQWQFALFDHLKQPQGSIYYCDKHVPADYSTIID